MIKFFYGTNLSSIEKRVNDYITQFNITNFKVELNSNVYEDDIIYVVMLQIIKGE